MLLGFLDFANQRQHGRTDVFDLLLEVQEAAENKSDAAFALCRNAFRDLFACADRLRAGAVVVLNQVLERRVRPHTTAGRFAFS
jgi:hypothetical protein